MLDLDRLAAEARAALAAGNVVAVVRTYVGLLAKATPLEQRVLLAVLRTVLARYGSQLGAAERTAVRRLLQAISRRRHLNVELRALRMMLQAAQVRQTPNGIGCATILLAGTGTICGREFGACQPLQVTVRPWKGEIALAYAAQGELLGEAFRQGALAALEYLARTGLGSLDNAMYLGAHSCIGSLPQIAAPVDGTSLGLGAAVATLSALLRTPVDNNHAFTGRVDINTRVYPVGGLAAKLEAARDKGVRRVFVPATNRDDVPKACRGMVHLVGELAEVVDAVFSQDAVHAAVARIQEEPVPERVRARHWLLVEEATPRNGNWLFTCVGSRDPFGPLAERPELPQTRGDGVEDGPVLAACRALRPRKVFLFHTAAARNDYSGRAAQVQELLQRDDPECDVQLVPLQGVDDPTDYMQLVPAFRAAVETTLATNNPSGAALYVNLSPGVPQMETTWHLLVERRLLPARRLQVREGRWVPEGESRVRLADPPPMV